MAKQLTQMEIINRANEKHGNKYDYSKVVYLDSKTKIEIVCPEHGPFWQNPVHHYSRGQGCPECVGGRVKMTSLNFIDRSNIVHHNKYDYTLVDQVGSRLKVDIVCKEHGVFQQRCDQHLEGAGCPKCASKIGTQEKFVTEATAKFGDRFDYSQVQFVSNNVKVDIICYIHGVFRQTPYKHLTSTHGCKKCGEEASAKAKEYTQEEWVTKAKQLHADKYSYGKVKYTKAIDKVTITCPVHGDFEQTAAAHLGGYGCKHCSSYGGGKSDIYKECMLYYFNIVGTNLYKVGITSQSISNRYRTKFDRDQINLVFTQSYSTGKEAYAIEQAILKKYTKNKYIGEKIMSTGNTEIFTKDVLGLDVSCNDNKKAQWEKVVLELQK